MTTGLLCEVGAGAALELQPRLCLPLKARASPREAGQLGASRVFPRWGARAVWGLWRRDFRENLLCEALLVTWAGPREARDAGHRALEADGLGGRRDGAPLVQRSGTGV